METLTQKEVENIQRLLGISLALITVTGAIAFRMKQQKQSSLSVQEFLGLSSHWFTSQRGLQTMLVGMVGGFIFGMIDNGGLWFGMDALDPFFVKKLGVQSGSNEAAGLGNTFSDGLGAFLGTFMGIIVSEYSGISLEEAPIWANAIGIILGCYVGILIGKTFSSST